MATHPLFIDGQWCDPVEPRLRPVINPANEDVLAQVAVAGAADAEAAIGAARKAFDRGDWPWLGVCERAAILDGGVIVADRPTPDLLRDESLLAAHRLELPYGFAVPGSGPIPGEAR